jgi:hypothetical protein
MCMLVSLDIIAPSYSSAPQAIGVILAADACTLTENTPLTGVATASVTTAESFTGGG